MTEYLIIHNQQDEHSRAFVKELPRFRVRYPEHSFCVLDWYTKDEERWQRTCKCHRGQPFFGVPPSAMPEIHTLRSDGRWGRIRLAQSIEDIHNPKLWDWQNKHGDCLGGQWTQHISDTLVTLQSRHHRLARLIQSVYEKHVFARIIGVISEESSV